MGSQVKERIKQLEEPTEEEKKSHAVSMKELQQKESSLEKELENLQNEAVDQYLDDYDFALEQVRVIHLGLHISSCTTLRLFKEIG